MSPAMFDRLKSLPLTILLTVLIWMYAEAKFTATQENVRLTLKPVSPNGDLVLRALDPGESRYQATINLLVTLQGPQNQVDRIYQESLGVAQQDEEFTQLVYVPPAASLKVGTGNRVDTVAALNGLSYFRNRGVTVTAATPSQMDLEVERVVQIPKPIEFRPPFPVERFTARPEQVIVNVPEKVLAEIGGPDRITVNAIPPHDAMPNPVAGKQTVTVRYVVDYPGVGAARDEGITVTPAQGEVLLELPKH